LRASRSYVQIDIIDDTEISVFILHSAIKLTSMIPIGPPGDARGIAAYFLLK